MHRPGYLGSVEVTHIAVAEVAVLVAVAVASRGLIPGIIAGVVAALLVVAAFARRRGRWWAEDVLLAWRQRRRRSSALDPAVDPALAALRTLAPRVSVRDVSAPDGARVGVARDEAGWYAAVTLEPSAPVYRTAAPISVDALLGVLADADQPAAVLQLVTHTVPAPSLGLHPTAPATASYRQLTDPDGPVALPAHRESTVVVRVDARTLAESLLDHTTDPDSAEALAAALGRRVARSLRRLGVAGRVLDADELLRALARSCDLDAGGPAVPVREEWAEWRSAVLAHRVFWLRRWPAEDNVGPLLDWAAALPAAQTDVAVILTPADGDDVAIRVLIRVAGPPEALPGITRHLHEGAGRFGAQLLALHGEHGPGVYATAPTGGGAG